MDLYKLGSPNEHKGQSIIHLIQIQESPIQVLMGSLVFVLKVNLVLGLFFPNFTRIKSQ